MANKSKTYVHWVLWSDKEEQEWIVIGKTRFDADQRGLTKFMATPTCAWGWRCVTLPEGERPPELPPLAQRPDAADGTGEEEANPEDGEILPGIVH
jgi:hypothetical protein